jgi:hypothetical protein
MEAPIITIGGEQYELPPISFGKIKRAGPIIAALSTATNDIEVRTALIGVIAIFLRKEPEQLEELITYVEVTALLPQWPGILTWAGLVPAAPGEVQAASSQPIASTI